MPPPSIWHYPRTEFAEKIATLLTQGPGAGVTLYGAAGSGKTAFLANDLLPMLRERGQPTYLVSLQGIKDNPAAFFLKELQKSLSEEVDSELGVNVPMFNIEVSTNLNDLIDLFLKKNTKWEITFLFDDFDQLANEKDFLYHFRTLLDERKSKISSLFSGQDTRLFHRMFNDPKEPFYRFTQQYNLPDLPPDFIDHQLRVSHDVAHRKVSKATAEKIFTELGQSPAIFLHWLKTILLDPSLEEEAYRDFLIETHLSDQAKIYADWDNLNHIQRTVLRLLAEKYDGIYGHAALRRAVDLLQTPELSASKLQTALNTLENRGVVTKVGKKWRIIHAEAESWILSLPEGHFRRSS